MRFLNYLLVLLISTIFVTCSNNDEEITVEDTVLEFVFFERSSFTANEMINSTAGNEIILQAQMLSYPRNEDVVVTLNVTGENVEEGVDFEILSPNRTITIPAGEANSSEGFILRTINNDIVNTNARSIIVSIVSVSDAQLNIGERPTDPEKAKVTIEVKDDDEACSDEYDVFGGENLTSTISITETDGSFDPYDFSYSVTTSLNGDKLTLTGDIIDFFEADLTVQMIPDTNDVTVGTVSFTEQDLGVHSDGYQYRLVQVQEGTFDACMGTMTIYYDLEYEDSGDWYFYYRLQGTFSL
ncbi:hypothetical protein [Tenacibaculum sp. SG-28]|uniref:hypothetical protein n=1 Tax=Tenacibaculum sp. SG-28 TaxID=754426 RepID=UPI000CF559D2|nr:hypothetical protein [Tenacibaculum sp. SG-28]PQJ20804.1 hypothetical protein BSU00_11065 [Tenacibaculum sp. SG-28]